MGVVKQITVSAEDRGELERIVAAASSEVRLVERARIVLAAGEGLKGLEIADRVGCSEPTVVKWRGRYAREGLDGLRDVPRSGPPLTHGPVTRALLITKACTRPKPTEEGARRERWTYEELAAEVGMSGSQAHTILSRAEIKPHLTEYWIMSDFSRPEFEQRCGEVCGLYVDPPENVLVVSLDEKTGIQAKSPVEPDSPPEPGQPARTPPSTVPSPTPAPLWRRSIHRAPRRRGQALRARRPRRPLRVVIPCLLRRVVFRFRRRRRCVHDRINGGSGNDRINGGGPTP